MAKYKSIRLDFPAAGLSVDDEVILGILQRALSDYQFKQPGHIGYVAGRLLVAARAAVVNDYDNKRGSPVFYIP